MNSTAIALNLQAFFKFIFVHYKVLQKKFSRQGAKAPRGFTSNFLGAFAPWRDINFVCMRSIYYAQIIVSDGVQREVSGNGVLNRRHPIRGFKNSVFYSPGAKAPG